MEVYMYASVFHEVKAKPTQKVTNKRNAISIESCRTEYDFSQNCKFLFTVIEALIPSIKHFLLNASDSELKLYLWMEKVELYQNCYALRDQSWTIWS
jgi:hypothetical protein